MAFDVVIIGAGFTGLSAALHLAEGGAKVAVLEAAEIGFGGSGRNVGLVNAGMWVMPESLPGELGEEFGRRLLDQLGAAPAAVFELVERHGIDCQASRSGTLHCANDDAGFRELEDRARQWQALDAPVELLDAERTERRVGTRAYRGSLLDKRAGTIQPLAYVRGLAWAAIEAGATIFCDSAVLSREELAAGWRVLTAQGSVTSDWLLIATETYSTAGTKDVRSDIVRLPYFNLATAPLSDNVRRSILPQREGVWDTRTLLSSFRFDRDNRLIFGSVGALHSTGTRIHRYWGRRSLAKLFPQLGDIEFDHEWYGAIGMTDNALPRFHCYGRNCYSISGYNGRGIGPGTVFGRDLARLALGQARPEDLSLPLTNKVPARFRSIRENFYTFGSQIAHTVGPVF